MRPDFVNTLMLLFSVVAIPTFAEQPNRTITAPSSGFVAPHPSHYINMGATLPEMEALALSKNPTLQKLRIQVRAAKGVAYQVGLYPNPTVGYVGDDMGAEGTMGKQGAFIGQEFVTGHKRQLAQSVANHRVVEAQHALEIQRFRVLSDVRTRYYDALVAQAIVDLDKKLVAIGQKTVQTTEQLFAGQDVSWTNVLQAKIEADSANLKLEEARNAYRTTWRRLSAVIGVSDLQPVRLDGDLRKVMPKRSWEALVDRLKAESPELSQAHAGVNRAQCALAHERAKRVSNVNVQAGVFHDNTIDDTVTNIEVSMPLPIFDRNQGNICRAEAELIAAEKEVRRVELKLVDRLAKTFERYTNGRRRVEIYESSILPKAKESLDIVQKGYRLGGLDFLPLLTAQRTFFQASLEHLASLHRLRKASIEIDNLLLHGGLEQTDGR